ncbi:MAG: SufS family cysteine desulfurase [Miltoncostaeaceae bacterium]
MSVHPVDTPAGLDVEALRADFPILERRVHGVPLVYLDSAATSQKPRAVLEAMDAYYEQTNANVHRGVYELAAEATSRFEAGRAAVAGLVNASPECTVLAKNASEAINLVAWAWGVRGLADGDEIVVTEMEHHSDIVPWQIVAGITGATVRFCPVTAEGELDLDAMASLIGPRTRMVGVVHASNVLGTINPVAEVARMAHEAGALCLVDASQSVPHMPVDFAALGCDLMAFTGHKMLGPTGVGVLVGTREVLEGIEPFLGGGEMISNVTTTGSTWADLPHKFEAGTPPIAEGVGLGAAVGYLDGLGMENVRAHEREMAAYMLDALGEVPGIVIHGPRDPDRRGAVVSFSLPDIHPHDIAHLVDQEGVCIRAGHHCAKPLMRVLGVGATARASAYVYNTTEDIDHLVRALATARAALS